MKRNIRKLMFEIVVASFAILAFATICTLFLIADTTGWW